MYSILKSETDHLGSQRKYKNYIFNDIQFKYSVVFIELIYDIVLFLDIKYFLSSFK